MPRPLPREPYSPKSRQEQSQCSDWESPFGNIDSEDAQRLEEIYNASTPLSLQMRLQHEVLLEKLSLQESLLREVLQRRAPRRASVRRSRIEEVEVVKKEAKYVGKVDKVDNGNEGNDGMAKVANTKVEEADANLEAMEPIGSMEPMTHHSSKRSYLTSYSNEDLTKKDSALKIHGKYLRDAFLKRGLKVREVESCVKWLVKHQLFEAFFALVVVSNSVFIGVEVARSIQAEPDAPLPLGVQVTQYIYTFLFTTELILRIIAYRAKFICSDDWMWAILDIFIVATSLWEVGVDILQAFYQQGTDLEGMTAIMNMKTFRIIRLTRLLKTIQFVKIFRFVMALRMLVTSIMSTLKALFWALVLLILVVYVFGVLFAQAVNDPDIRLPEAERIAADRYFGNLEISMLSLFMSIAGGVSWEEVIFPLRRISALWVFAFLFYVAFTYFAVLNVVTGVFCQSAIESAKNDHAMVVQSMLDNKAAHLAKIRALFDEFGTEQGVLTIGVFEDKINSPAVREYFEALGLDIWDAWSFFKLLDEDSDGSVEIEEFFLGCLRFRGAARSMDVGKLIQDQKWLIKHQGKVQHFIEEEFDLIRADIQDVHDLIKQTVPE